MARLGLLLAAAVAAFLAVAAMSPVASAFIRRSRDTVVGVLDRRALNQLVKKYCVPLIPDGDAKRHNGLYWFGR